MSKDVKIAVLDYGIGNLRSAEKALQKVGGDARLTSEAKDIENADGVVLPGVGAFGACMKALENLGLDEQVKAVVKRGQPLLGVCVGMQLLYESSEESPGIPGLSLLKGAVKALPTSVRRPQMQWNTLTVEGDHPLLVGLENSWMYFVHSYAAEKTADVIASVEYGGSQPALVAHGSIVATQFHPEKSAEAGLHLLKNFVNQLGVTS